MDVFLTCEALQTTEALRRLAPGKKIIGFLLGHKRGNRFFVEKIFVVPRRSWPPLDEFYDLNRLFEGKIIGFFAFGPDERIKRRLLAPFAVGKAFLEILPARAGGQMKMSAWVIDFDGRFTFVRLPLFKEPAGPAGGGRP